MQLSRDEYLRISQLRPDDEGVRVVTVPAMGRITTAPLRRETSGVVSPLLDEALRVSEIVEREPEVREDIVASLRARIEAGNYTVSGEQIAEMLVRRLLADRMR